MVGLINEWGGGRGEGGGKFVPWFLFGEHPN